MPYSSEIINDNTHLEHNNKIEVITGNRTTSVNWSDDSNLPDEWMFKYDGVWSGDGTLPENWNLSNSNIYQETWNDDNSPPEGWITRNPTVGLNLTLAEGWREDNILAARWTTRDNNITVRRNNRCILASKLPTIFVTNHRSFFPKFHNFLEVMHTLELTFGATFRNLGRQGEKRPQRQN